MNSSNLLEANVQIYAQVRSAYDQCAPEIQGAVDEMLGILNDSEATTDEREGAILTIAEALFPSLAADIREAHDSHRQSPEAAQVTERMRHQQDIFADRVQELMTQRGMTQIELADALGIGQPAVSNMLARRTRPQRKTVERVAGALGVPVDQLWPES